MVTVYADMVADLLHVGHINFLQSARALGDELVVGVHSDSDCARMKRTPVMSLDERIAVVSACRAVDRVIPGAPLFPSRQFIAEHGIDLVVHGDDFDAEQLRYWYGDVVDLGIVRTVPYTHGISSTEIEARVRGRTGPERPEGDPGTVLRLARRAARAAPRLTRAIERRFLVHNLRRLHAVLESGPLAGRWWICFGQLLGWAREGRPLDHDLKDADFAYLDEDHERFLAAIPALVDAGFAPLLRYADHDGRPVEHVFRRAHAVFEFFRFTPVDDRWRYTLTISGRLGWLLDSEIPAQPRVPFEYLGRTWRKVVDHEAELVAIYGDWRAPNPTWRFTEDRAIVARTRHPLIDPRWAYAPDDAAG